MFCTALTIGYHIATSHHDIGRRHHSMDEANPGLYSQCDSLVAGGFLNSVGRVSLYGAKAVPLVPKLDLVLGAVTGYGGVKPLVMLSYRASDGVRYSFIPTTPDNLGGLHISKEF